MALSREGKTRKKNVAKAWIDNKKYPSNMENKMSENVENKKISRRFHQKRYEKLVNGTNNRTYTSISKNPKRYLSGRLTIATIMCNSNDASKLYTKKL